MQIFGGIEGGSRVTQKKNGVYPGSMKISLSGPILAVLIKIRIFSEMKRDFSVSD